MNDTPAPIIDISLREVFMTILSIAGEALDIASEQSEDSWAEPEVKALYNAVNDALMENRDALVTLGIAKDGDLLDGDDLFVTGWGYVSDRNPDNEED